MPVKESWPTTWQTWEVMLPVMNRLLLIFEVVVREVSSIGASIAAKSLDQILLCPSTSDHILEKGRTNAMFVEIDLLQRVT